MIDVDLDKYFEYENKFYLAAPVSRISKFVTHLELFRKTSGLTGDIVECGVFKGNSLMRWIKFRALLGNEFSRKIIAFDSFGEFPEPEGETDRTRVDEFIEETGGGQSISREQLMGILEELGLSSNVELVEGNILKTVPLYVENNAHLKIALLHVDVDVYDATRVSLEQFYPAVVRGGVVVLDDYGAMPGANKAIDEFFLDKSLNIQKLPYSHAISYVEKS